MRAGSASGLWLCVGVGVTLVVLCACADDEEGWESGERTQAIASPPADHVVGVPMPTSPLSLPEAERNKKQPTADETEALAEAAQFDRAVAEMRAARDRSALVLRLSGGTVEEVVVSMSMMTGEAPEPVRMHRVNGEVAETLAGEWDGPAINFLVHQGETWPPMEGETIVFLAATDMGWRAAFATRVTAGDVGLGGRRLSVSDFAALF